MSTPDPPNKTIVDLSIDLKLLYVRNYQFLAIWLSVANYRNMHMYTYLRIHGTRVYQKYNQSAAVLINNFSLLQLLLLQLMRGVGAATNTM